jgi:hypothetical protein
VTATRRISLLTGTGIIVGTLVFGQTSEIRLVATISGPAEHVQVSGTVAYISAGAMLRVVDVRDPAAPKVRGTVELVSPITALAVSGTTVYAAVGLQGLAVVDVSKPDSPAVVGSLKTPGETVRIAVAGSKAVVADRMSGAQVIDISDAARPVSLGSYFTDGYTRDVAAAGAVAYVVDSSNDFAVVDLSKSGPPAALTVQGSTAPSTLVAVWGTASARRAYVLGSGALQTYDVSNSSAPKKLATSKIVAQPQAVAVDGSLAFVAAGNDGVQILDLSDPEKPAVVATYRTPGAARDVAVSSDLIFVVVTGSNPAGSVVVLRRPM